MSGSGVYYPAGQINAMSTAITQAEQALAASGYVAHVALDRASLDVDGRPQKLEPGMEVTAEIRTGRRRVISYLLSPLQRYAHEGMRER